MCECVCRKSFMTVGFSWVKHVVMDEVQIFRADYGDWLEKARRLVGTTSDDPDKDQAKNIELGHDFLGDEVKRVNCKPPFTSCLKKVLNFLLTEGHSEGEIAVLYGMESCIPNNLRSELNYSITAKENNSDCLVVSTLRKYSGLERPIVVLVNLRWERTFYCAVTRAMVKLVVIDVEW